MSNKRAFHETSPSQTYFDEQITVNEEARKKWCSDAQLRKEYTEKWTLSKQSATDEEKKATCFLFTCTSGDFGLFYVHDSRLVQWVKECQKPLFFEWLLDSNASDEQTFRRQYRYNLGLIESCTFKPSEEQCKALVRSIQRRHEGSEFIIPSDAQVLSKTIRDENRSKIWWKGPLNPLCKH